MMIGADSLVGLPPLGSRSLGSLDRDTVLLLLADRLRSLREAILMSLGFFYSLADFSGDFR